MYRWHIWHKILQWQKAMVRIADRRLYSSMRPISAIIARKATGVTRGRALRCACGLWPNASDRHNSAIEPPPPHCRRAVQYRPAGEWGKSTLESQGKEDVVPMVHRDNVYLALSTQPVENRKANAQRTLPRRCATIGTTSAELCQDNMQKTLFQHAETWCSIETTCSDHWKPRHRRRCLGGAPPSRRCLLAAGMAWPVSLHVHRVEECPLVNYISTGSIEGETGGVGSVAYGVKTQQTRHINTMFDKCWADVVDGGSTLVKHCADVSYMLGRNRRTKR